MKNHQFNIVIIGTGRSLLHLTESICLNATHNNVMHLNLHLYDPCSLKIDSIILWKNNFFDEQHKHYHLNLHEHIDGIVLHHESGQASSIDLILMTVEMEDEHARTGVELLNRLSEKNIPLYLITRGTESIANLSYFKNVHRTAEFMNNRIYALSADISKEMPFIRFDLGRAQLNNNHRRAISFLKKINRLTPRPTGRYTTEVHITQKVV